MTSAGATGATGAPGTAGTVGATGATGAPGTAGTVGATGATGAPGTAGTVGATGATGAPGTAGTVGATGATGAPGTAGTSGATGATGATGMAGANGATGAAGATGATGTAGTNGATGATGVQGSIGATGATGATGAQGMVGATGATGSAAPSGVAVTTATQNADGTTTYSFSGGTYFDNKPYSSFSDTYAPDGTLLNQVRDRNDGSHTVNVDAGDQTIASDFFDTFNNRGAPDTTYVFDPGHGLDVVNLFRVGGTDHDTVSLLGSDFGNSVAEVLHNTKDTKAGAVILDPTSGDTVRLTGVTKAQLVQNQGDIKFHG